MERQPKHPHPVLKYAIMLYTYLTLGTTFATGMVFLFAGVNWTYILVVLGMWVFLFLVVQFLTNKMYETEKNL